MTTSHSESAEGGRLDTLFTRIAQMGLAPSLWQREGTWFITLKDQPGLWSSRVAGVGQGRTLAQGLEQALADCERPRGGPSVPPPSTPVAKAGTLAELKALIKGFPK